MIFTSTEPNINVDLLNWRSETGRFELGMRSVIYGIRVVLSYPKGYGYEVNYCVGLNGTYIVLVFEAVRQVLLEFDEQCDVCDIRRKFPVQTIKPMNNDPVCFQHLLQKGAASLEKNPDQELESIDWKKNFEVMEERFQSRFTRKEAFRKEQQVNQQIDVL
ncbi:hypothetical protein [Chroococcidiopsis sp.]|uniref:hypothetical protein n=1 Tax=Chroococcidiopsis sp. TaxID=3088168 RepID=UPI003F3D6F92